ncbi:hypothetical protein JNB62_05025 [Microbacterium jejuense]|uniref:Uncharacterized protein n=1 Tax=Microbacterium jejuense TaxID=1263637 RepID=A0ABS7HJG4_9MICO|nr:hypothetical protein [Microbacterium jejuense]MBW9093037.1 hypothetical protein [Microbacterium jejuense]
MAAEPFPIWWRGITAPPPSAWQIMFSEFTGEDTADEWALAAAVFIAQTRRRTSHGPTFAELFTHLLPDTDGIPGPFPDGLNHHERRRAVTGFRGHVAIEWRRRGMISWDKDVTRSLRVGREFRSRSRRRQQDGGASPRHPASVNSDTPHRTGSRRGFAQAEPVTGEAAPRLRAIVDRFAPGWPELIDVGPGWFSLLVRLDERLGSMAPGYVLYQCKAKFGVLRYYASATGDGSPEPEPFDEAIAAAEAESARMCELCGAPAGQYVIDLWVYTFCARHAAEKNAEAASRRQASA